jgi:hypothetical protein
LISRSAVAIAISVETFPLERILAISKLRVVAEIVSAIVP